MPAPPSTPVHRTAWFAIHHPTRHVQAALERAFRDYTDAYTELLFVAARFDLDALRGMATYALDDRTSAPQMNARTLSQRLFTRPDLPRPGSGGTVSPSLALTPEPQNACWANPDELRGAGGRSPPRATGKAKTSGAGRK